VGQHLSTGVILADGCNNGKLPNPRALEEIAKHARQVIWTMPEPRWSWTLGSCNMPIYEKIRDRVEVVRAIDQLTGVAEEIVEVPA
jgi:uncharacterized protein with von Willebrand factor type A (vWA) domain